VKFDRYPIAVNSIASPGMQLVVRDFDGDGYVDIVIACKTGQYWFKNLKVNRVKDTDRETFGQRFPTLK